MGGEIKRKRDRGRGGRGRERGGVYAHVYDFPVTLIILLDVHTCIYINSLWPRSISALAKDLSLSHYRLLTDADLT